MKHYTAIVLGGGPSGISCGDHLNKRGIDYLIIEKKVMLQTWRHERWDSFYLVTPNWMTNFPGLEDHIPYDNGYMSKAEILNLLEAYLLKINPNYIENVLVERVYKEGDLYCLKTSSGEFTCDDLIMATGLFNKPFIPKVKNDFPSDVKQIHSMDYTNVSQLAPGSTLVVGSGRSGIQIALEVKQHWNQQSAQQANPDVNPAANPNVYLAIGSLTPIPTIYKNINGVYWLNQLSGFSRGPKILPYQKGDFEDESIMHKFSQNLAACQKAGVVLTGRLLAVSGNTLSLKGNLKQTLMAADDTLRAVESRIDGLIEQKALSVTDTIIPMDFERVDLEKLQDVTELDIKKDAIGNVIWCTGFRCDYQWLELDIFNQEGEIHLIDGVRTQEKVSFCGMSLKSTDGKKSSFGVGLFAIYESAERAVASLFD